MLHRLRPSLTSFLLWQLTSASARFQNCELLFDITQFFSIGYIGEVCSNFLYALVMVDVMKIGVVLFFILKTQFCDY